MDLLYTIMLLMIIITCTIYLGPCHKRASLDTSQYQANDQSPVYRSLYYITPPTGPTLLSHLRLLECISDKEQYPNHTPDLVPQESST